ncbi:hypothetical protein [Sphaerisporangium corydalis]|uniref:Uncharacterized protein n=1 Tax=Sphaerisporangium corydalis TaxID=1441875 RepID=A0ABV9EJC6_9ACTN|nr:hypothetical protein [Sphaerisporangium corydalis]
MTAPATPATGTMPRAGAAKPCPRCHAPLDGGPVLFHCAPCRRAVYAADLDSEFHATLGKAA